MYIEKKSNKIVLVHEASERKAMFFKIILERFEFFSREVDLARARSTKLIKLEQDQQLS